MKLSKNHSGKMDLGCVHCTVSLCQWPDTIIDIEIMEKNGFTFNTINLGTAGRAGISWGFSDFLIVQNFIHKVIM